MRCMLGVMAAVFLAWSGGTAAQSTSELLKLESPSAQQTLLQQVRPAWTARLQDASVAGFVLAEPDLPSPAWNAQRLDVAITRTLTVHARRLRYETLPGGLSLWVGQADSERLQATPSAQEVPLDSLNMVMVVRHGESLTGLLRVRGEQYQILPLGGRLHAVVHLDSNKRAPTDHAIEAPAQTGVEREPPVAPPHTDVSIIRVMIAVSRQMRASTPDLDGLLALYFAYANQVNENSRVPIVFEHAGTLDTDYDEAQITSPADYDRVLTKAKNPEDPELGRLIAPFRDQQRADLVVMMIEKVIYCGAGVLTATRESAFSVVSGVSRCGYNSFPHEMGHNIGANHDRETLGGTRNPPYAHGYRHKDEERGFHTLMAYYCTPVSLCPLIDHWANPQVSYGGLPTGTAEYEDVARRLDERRETVADFYPPPADAAPPVAEAVVSPAEVTGGASVTLDGSGSSNPGGGALRYEWRLLGGTPAASIEDAAQAVTRASIPPVAQDRVYTFELVVTNADGLSASRQVRVEARRGSAGDLSGALALSCTARGGELVPVYVHVINPSGLPLRYQWYSTGLVEGFMGSNPEGAFRARNVTSEVQGKILVDVDNGVNVIRLEKPLTVEPAPVGGR